MPAIQTNEVWALDATYTPRKRGFVNLTSVVDVASRRVLAHKGSITLEACHAAEVIKQALARYGTPAIVNTDQESQFTVREFTQVVPGAGCKWSMDGRGLWRNNVLVDWLWRTVKYQHVYEHVYASVSRVKLQIVQYVDWNNAGRVHSILDDQTSDQAYWHKLPKLAVAS